MQIPNFSPAEQALWNKYENKGVGTPSREEKKQLEELYNRKKNIDAAYHILWKPVRDFKKCKAFFREQGINTCKILAIGEDGEHAEIRMLGYLIETGKLQRGKSKYIGLSKLCCARCIGSVGVINKAFSNNLGIMTQSKTGKKATCQSQDLTTTAIKVGGQHGLDWKKNWHPPRYLKLHRGRDSSRKSYITENSMEKIFSPQNTKGETVQIIKKEKINPSIIEGEAYLSLADGYIAMCKELDKAIAEKRQRKKEEQHTAEYEEKGSEDIEEESEEKSGKTANKSMLPSSSSSDANISDSPVVVTRDAIDVTKSILGRFNRLNDDKDVRKIIPTKGGGDCALHAILGEWSARQKKIEYKKIKEARKMIFDAIVNQGENEKLDDLIDECIRDWIMSGNLKGYPESRNLWRSYNAFVIVQGAFAEKHWEEFSEQISQYKDVMQYISKHHGLSSKSTFKDQFYNVLSQDDDTLQGLIASIPALQTAFTEYNRNINVDFDWQQISPAIREEFARFINTPRTWLAPAELNIIAHIFNKTVEYYPAPRANRETFNPGKSDIVAVQFNGVDHFERIDRDSSLITDPSIPNRGHRSLGK